MTKRVDFEVPEGARISPCRACGAEMAWRETGKLGKDGRPKFMPLDLASAERGLDGVLRAESHHARCPEAEQFRSRS